MSDGICLTFFFRQMYVHIVKAKLKKEFTAKHQE